MRDEIEEETDFNEKKIACKIQNFYILLAFLLGYIAISIYCCLIKYQAKQKNYYHFMIQIPN